MASKKKEINKKKNFKGKQPKKMHTDTEWYTRLHVHLAKINKRKEIGNTLLRGLDGDKSQRQKQMKKKT